MKYNIKKFFIIYSTVMLVAVLITGLMYNIYVNSLLSLIQETSRNPVMIHDTFTLKKNISPFVIGDIQKITIIDSNRSEIFKHDQTNSSFLVIDIKHNVIENGNLLYSVILSMNYKSFVVIILVIGFILLFLYFPFVQYEKKEFLNRSNEAMADLSKKLAHDIRSPISTLNLISSKIKDADIKDLQLAVVSQINFIAEDLLKTHKNYTEESVLKYKNKDQSCADFFERILNEYEVSQRKGQRKIKFSIDDNLKSIPHEYAKILYPIICNILNNSIEATNEHSGVITLTVFKNENNIVINITDNGKGIPKEILKKLGNKVFSYGKLDSNQSGNGLALFNADKDLKKINGALTIKSELNHFTNIEIKITKP